MAKRELLELAYQAQVLTTVSPIPGGTHGANEPVSNFFARLVIGRVLGQDPSSIETTKDTAGKPRVNIEHGIEFNLSDSGEFLGIGVSRGMPLGLDLEVLNRERTPLRVAWRFFSEVEKQSLGNLPPSRQKDHFLLLWTLKEAFVKANGWRLADVSLSDFGFRVTTSEIEFWSRLDHPSSGALPYFATFVVSGKARMSLCALRDSPVAVDLRIREITGITGARFKVKEAYVTNVMANSDAI